MHKNKYKFTSINNISFQQKLFLIFVICATIPLIICFIISFFQFSIFISDNTTKEYNNTVVSTGHNIESYLDEMQRLSITPYEYSEMMTIFSYYNNEKKDVTKIYNLSIAYEKRTSRLLALSSKNIVGITFFPINDNYQKGYSVSLTTLVNEFDASIYPVSDWIPTQKDNYKYVKTISPHVINYYEDRKSINVFSIVKPVRIFDTQKDIGMIKIDSRSSQLDEFFANLQLSKNSGYFLINGNNQILFSNNPDIDKNVLSALNGNDKSFKLYKLYSYPIKNSDWKVLYYSSFYNQLNSILIILSIYSCTLITLLFISFFLFKYYSRSLTLPIQNILSTMDSVSKGNLSVTADESIKMDKDFATITKQLNIMIESLNIHIRNEYMAVINQKNAEYYALQAQINPHFLYNTLNNFIALNRIGEKRLLENSIIKLKDIFYYICKKKNKITLFDEFQFIENYLMLQKIRFEDRLSFVIDIDDSVKDFEIDKLLIQPLVENSIIHGMEKSIEMTLIEVYAFPITINNDGDFLMILVRDNGEGCDPKSLKGKICTGINNIKDRLDILSSNSVFSFKSIPNKFTLCCIAIPAHKDIFSTGFKFILSGKEEENNNENTNCR